MRVAGILTLVATGIVVAIFCLLPTSVTLLGTTASCGPPIAGAWPQVHPDDALGLGQQCRNQSVVRLAIGFAVLVVGATGGTLMTALGGPTPRPPAPWPPYGPPR